MNKGLMAGALAALVLLAIGCETVKGIGKDVSTVGGWLTRGSEKAQNPPEPTK